MCCFRRSKNYVIIPPFDYFINPSEYSVITKSMYKRTPWWYMDISAIYEKYGHTYTYEEIMENLKNKD